MSKCVVCGQRARSHARIKSHVFQMSAESHRKAFLAELAGVCEKYRLSVSHVDSQGVHRELVEWLREELGQIPALIRQRDEALAARARHEAAEKTLATELDGVQMQLAKAIAGRDTARKLHAIESKDRGEAEEERDRARAALAQTMEELEAERKRCIKAVHDVLIPNGTLAQNIVERILR